MALVAAVALAVAGAAPSAAAQTLADDDDDEELLVEEELLSEDDGAQVPRAAATADDFLQLGLARFRARAYAEAIDAFAAGYALEPRPELLFALAQAERLRGDCAAAAGFYRRFLQTGPPERQAVAAVMHLERCEAELAAATPTPPAAPDSAAAEAAAPTPGRRAPATLVAAPEPLPWYHDTLGDALLGAGLICAVASVGFLGAADAAGDAARDTRDRDRSEAHQARASRNRAWALITGSMSVGLLGAAIYRFREPRLRAPARLGVVPQPGGATISLGGHF